MVKRLGILLLFCGAALLTVTAYWLLFTSFMAHDDEGYVLLSLENYSLHGGLYSQVFSQYGPFFYFLHDAGHRLLGYEFTNTTGRLITLVCWMVATGTSAHLVWRQTRSATLTGFTLGLTFFHLRLMVSEPIHPGGLIAALVAIGAWGGAWLISRGAMTGLAITTGLLGAALFFTKINVGVFFIAAAGTWFATQLRDSNQARLTGLVTAGLLVLLPIGLMHAELGEEWGRIFAGLSVVASLTMVSTAWRDRQPLTTWRHAGLGLGLFLLLGVLVIGAVGLRGTTMSEMAEGILLGPLRHPGVYHYPPDWKPGAAVVGGLSLLVAVLVWRRMTVRLNWLLIGLRLLVVVWVALASVEWLPFTSHSSVMSYALPLAWVFALRLDPGPNRDQPNVAPWVGLLLVLQYLHAYPVAGSQIAWGTFLIVPLMALGLHDTQRFLAERGRPAFSRAIGIGCLALAVIAAGRLAPLGWHRYTESRPLHLSGAENVRPPEDFAGELRLLTLNATAHGDMLFSLPGMFSFNRWTELPTPTLSNATHWFSLLTPQQQADIAAALTRSKRPVLIVHRGLLNFLTDSNFVISSPLHDYLNENFTRVFKLGYYEFWVRRGRVIVPLATAEFLQLASPQPGLAANRLELVVMVPAGARLARIELATLEDQPRILSHWDITSGPLLVTQINLQGAALSPETEAGWEQPLPPLVRLHLPLDKLVPFDRHTNVVYLRAAGGALLAEARFID